VNHFLIVGLGNPGTKYEKTRHNIGFILLDSLLEDLGNSWITDKKSLYSKYTENNCSFHFLKPQEYMNLSGKEVGRIVNLYKIPVSRILVVHDEIDLPFGKIKNKIGGGTAGHNGLSDIVDRIGDKGFHRLRFGVGKPLHPDFAVADYVLQRFFEEEQVQMNDLILESKKRIKEWVQQMTKQTQVS
jgi:PTH1 family peptidyl-tRNA hydrolase